MKDITFRVDEELDGQLRDLAEQEGEPVSVVLRRIVRRHVRTERPDVQRTASVHEGTGRVR